MIRYLGSVDTDSSLKYLVSMYIKPIDQQLLDKMAEYIEYSEDSPTKLIWKKQKAKCIKVGSICGNLMRDKRRDGESRYSFMFDCKTYQCSRLVWMLFNGLVPEGMLIDHVDRNPLNNSIDNLRIVTMSVNAHNARVQTNNKTGVTGVFWHKSTKRWYADIRVDNTRKYLGSFHSFDEAVSARKTAEVLYSVCPITQVAQ